MMAFVFQIEKFGKGSNGFVFVVLISSHLMTETFCKHSKKQGSPIRSSAQLIKMTAARARSPLCSHFRAKFARVTDPGLLSSRERKTIDFLASMTAKDLFFWLRLEAKDMRAKEWKRSGGFDGAPACAVCDSTPATHQKEKFPRHDCEHLDGCCGCNPDFHTSEESKRTGWTLTLCEFCHQEGKWTRFGHQVFKVVRLSQLFLVGCAESVIWSFEQCSRVMLSDALAEVTTWLSTGFAGLRPVAKLRSHLRVFSGCA
jgi:hypothetical protein